MALAFLAMYDLIFALFLAAQIIPVAGAPVGAVEGRITNLDGTLAADVRVTAQPVPDAGAPAVPVLISIARTDTAGRFRLENIPPGRYYVAAGLVDAPTYYPGVTGLENARIVDVTTGPAQEIGFALARPVALNVRGKVIYEPRAVHPPNLRVLISSPIAQQNGMVSPDGTFEFKGLPPATYRLILSPPNGSTAQQLVLTDRDAQIDLVMPFTVTVTGTIKVEDNLPQPRVPITFTDVANQLNRVTAAGAQNGTYTVQLKPGTYAVTSAIPQGFALESLVSGTTDLLNSPFVVTADAAPEFAAVLKATDPNAFVSVSGKVTGSPRYGNLLVRLNPAIAAGFGGVPITPLQAAVGADGSFEFPKVLPGSYNAIVDNEQVELNVSTRGLTGIEIALPEIVDVPAHVQVQGGGPVPRLSFGLIGSMNRRTAVRTTMQDPEHFRLGLPLGQNTLSILLLPPGYVLQSMVYDSSNLLTNPINVTAASREKEIEITLSLAPGIAPVRVTGRIQSGTSPFSSPVQITLLGPANPRDPIVTTNGKFEIPQVLPGNYTLRAFSMSQGINLSMPLAVGSSDVNGLQVQMPSSLKETSGRMVFDQGPDVGQPRFWMELTPVSGGNTLTVYSLRQANGSFSVRLPLGEWRVSVAGLPPASNLKSAFYGDDDILRDTLKVSAADSKELRLTFVPKPGNTFIRVRGRVVPPKDSSDLSQRFRAVTSTIHLMGDMAADAPIQPDGTFEFPKLLSGTYSWCCNFGFTNFNLPGNDVDDLTFRAITGRVVIQGAIAPNTYVQAVDSAGTSAANLQSDGSFLLLLREGSFRIGMDRVPAGFYLQSIRYGSTELTNQTLVLPRGEDAQELILTLAPKQ